jgi:hypothetical protein
MQIVRTALFLAASTALPRGLLIGAASTGLGPASGTAFLFFGLSTTCTRLGSASGAAIGGTSGDQQARAGDQAGDAHSGQHLFQLFHFHGSFTSFLK